jgi:hypothetical protein
MARLTIESQAAPAMQGPVEQRIQEAAVLCGIACGLVAALNPGIVAGGVFAAGWREFQRPRTWVRILSAALLVVPLVAVRSFIAPAWPWRGWLFDALPLQISAVGQADALRSFYTEALAGPAWFEVVLLVVVARRRTLGAQVRQDHRRDKQRWQAIVGRGQPVARRPRTPGELDSRGRHRGHPEGCVRIGIDAETNLPFDLELPAELAMHTLLVGASGSGKTTTLTTIVDGALGNGYAAVIVDCKGGGLGDIAGSLARRRGVPFHLVDPDDSASLGYNPCSGDPAAVANKLIGAFTYSPAAEIYKHVAMEAIPVVVRALHAHNEAVTLDALYETFGPRGIAKLALKMNDRHMCERLLVLGARTDDRTGKGGHAGLRHRLGALLEGKFGALFRATQSLDWDKALAEPSVTYVALSALASSEDVELMGRVIAQDLKQACARRMRAQMRGEALVPVLAVFDEFAALDEADQLVDLLLQARQALMPIVVSTQYLPESVPLRRSVLGAGLLIAHRVEGEDAEAIANQFGTRRASEVTHQVDYETGYSEKGSIRRVEEYNVHPNQLRTFTTGQAAVKSVARRRYSIVRVARDMA